MNGIFGTSASSEDVNNLNVPENVKQTLKDSNEKMEQIMKSFQNGDFKVKRSWQERQKFIDLACSLNNRLNSQSVYGYEARKLASEQIPEMTLLHLQEPGLWSMVLQDSFSDPQKMKFITLFSKANGDDKLFRELVQQEFASRLNTGLEKLKQQQKQ